MVLSAKWRVTAGCVRERRIWTRTLPTIRSGSTPIESRRREPGCFRDCFGGGGGAVAEGQLSEPELEELGGEGYNGDGLKPESGWVDMIQGDKITIPFWWTGGNDPFRKLYNTFQNCGWNGWPDPRCCGR